MPVIRVAWLPGKTHLQKATVAADITKSIVRTTGTEAKYIQVLFEDVKPGDWAGEGRLFAGEPQPQEDAS